MAVQAQQKHEDATVQPYELTHFMHVRSRVYPLQSVSQQVVS